MLWNQSQEQTKDVLKREEEMKKLLVLLSLIFVGVAYAQTQTINWWVGGQSYQTTTCETGGNVTPPANPTKRGHHFTGWEVALYDFSTSDASVNGNKHTSDTSTNTWTVTFDYGTISGKYLCSATGNTSIGQSGNPDENTSGVNCWCKATTYIPNGSNIVYENITSSVGLYISSWSDCTSRCNGNCAYYIRASSSVRRGLFGITQ